MTWYKGALWGQKELLQRSWQYLDMIKWDDINYLRFKLIKVKNGSTMVITHEQGVLTSFLGLDSLELFFGIKDN
jgi:hypothetical protein